MITVLFLLLFALCGIQNLYCKSKIDIGKVILNKNLNLASQLIRANTIYIVKDDFDLNDPKGENPITIPTSCTLQFKGGHINNGVLVGQDTQIDASLTKIFGNEITLVGTWNVSEAYSEWFGAKGDGITDDREALQSAINSFVSIKLCPKTYLCNNVLKVRDNRTLFGYGSTLKCQVDGRNQLEIIGNNTIIKGVIFDNIAKGYPEYGYDNGGRNSNNIVYNHSINGITVEECIFKNAICGLYIHSACRDINIRKCLFDGFKSLPNDHSDPLRSCAGGYGICLDADNSDGKDIDNIYNVKITDCIFRNVQRHCIYIQCVYGCTVENNFFYANRNQVHPTPFDAVMMVCNTIGLKVVNNEFNDALEAMHLNKRKVPPYNTNELKNITIENNTFRNCGDDRGANGVIGTECGDSIDLINNKFLELRGKMGAMIGLNNNNNVSIINNSCVVSSKCAWNATIIRFNSSNIKNVTIVGNKIDFSNTGKTYDKLIYTDVAADSLIVKDNVIVDGHSQFLISVPNITHKIIKNNRNTMSGKKRRAYPLLEKTKNLVSFLPVGLFLGVFFRNMSWRKVLLVGTGLSVIIEVYHFLTRRDLFEMDDVVCNALGAVVGFGIYLLLRYNLNGKIYLGVL